MERVYISGPMSDKDVTEAKKDFQIAEARYRVDNYSVINPYKLRDILIDGTWEEYMLLCLSLVYICDKIHMMKGGENSKGCKKELEMAKKLKKTIIYERKEEK